MAPLGPFGTLQAAVAVSGGADSVCLAWLARAWGHPFALIVDHRLRPGSADEAAATAARLAGFGVPSRILVLHGLHPGPGLAARARTARYAALAEACAGLGLIDLLLGHHARDQAETVLMRQAAASGPRGLAAMPALREQDGIRLLRPVLGIAPGRLRDTLAAAGIGWIEDPSNTDRAALRSRLRQGLADPPGTGPEVRRLVALAAGQAAARGVTDRRVAATLAARAAIFPEGYAVLTPGPIAPDSLSSLIRMLGGRGYAPDTLAVRRLAADPVAGTLGGVRLLPAGRLGPGTLLVREAAAIGPAVPARAGAVWDGRFVLSVEASLPDGVTIAALGTAAAGLRRSSALPAAVLRTLPALWRGSHLCAVPHLAYHAGADAFTGWTNLGVRLTLRPAAPAAGAAWVGNAQAARTHHVA